MKRQHLVVAAILLAAASIFSGSTACAETQGEFLRNKNNYAKGSAQYMALAGTPQH